MHYIGKKRVSLIEEEEGDHAGAYRPNTLLVLHIHYIQIQGFRRHRCCRRDELIKRADGMVVVVIAVESHKNHSLNLCAYVLEGSH